MSENEMLSDERWETYLRAALSMLTFEDYVRALAAIAVGVRWWQIESGLVGD